jgi:HSP20 family protein
MKITDLIPWKRKKRTKVPVRVVKQPVQALDRAERRRSDELARWFGLAPLGVLGDRWEMLGPRMDMVEDDEGFRVTVEVPGMDEEDIDVALAADRLTIRGERREEKVRRGPNAYGLRRSYERFQRSIVLPCPVDAERVEATLRRGVLTVRLPRTEGGGGRRRIPVRGT